MTSKHRNPRGPLLDMREHAQRVAAIMRGRTIRDVTDDRDLMLRPALERLLEIIGEAANRVPREVQDRFPQIPWAAIIGLRNLLAHGYDSIDPQKLWATATVNVPELLRHLDAAIEQQPPFEN